MPENYPGALTVLTVGDFGAVVSECVSDALPVRCRLIWREADFAALLAYRGHAPGC